jgi:hypothetical protein
MRTECWDAKEVPNLPGLLARTGFWLRICRLTVTCRFFYLRKLLQPLASAAPGKVRPVASPIANRPGWLSQAYAVRMIVDI